MKWYNYKDKWLNIEHCYGILKMNTSSLKFIFPGDGQDCLEIWYRDDEEREAEFEKIKILMGIEDFTSRCC
jgi:hypothetical protein